MNNDRAKVHAEEQEKRDKKLHLFLCHTFLMSKGLRSNKANKCQSLSLSLFPSSSCLKKLSWNWDKPFLSSRRVFAAKNLFVYWCHLVRGDRILYLWVCAELPHEKSLFSHLLSLTYSCEGASEINLK